MATLTQRVRDTQAQTERVGDTQAQAEHYINHKIVGDALIIKTSQDEYSFPRNWNYDTLTEFETRLWYVTVGKIYQSLVSCLESLGRRTIRLLPQ